MALQSYCDHIASQVALPRTTPGAAAPAHPEHVQVFRAELLRNLEAMGVRECDLQMRDLCLVDPRYVGPRFSGPVTRCRGEIYSDPRVMIWGSTATLETGVVLDHQAAILDSVENPGAVGRASVFDPLAAADPDNAGLRATLGALDAAPSADAVLGVWVLAACMTLTQAYHRLAWKSFPRLQTLSPSIYSGDDRFDVCDAETIAREMIGADGEFPDYARQSNRGLPLTEPLLVQDRFAGMRRNHDDTPDIVAVIAGLIAANARTFVPVAIHPIPEATDPWIGREIRRRTDKRVADRLAYAEQLRNETPLERAYRMLPSKWRGKVVPGSRDFQAADDAELLAQRPALPIAVLAVIYDTTEARMASRLSRAARQAAKAKAS